MITTDATFSIGADNRLQFLNRTPATLQDAKANAAADRRDAPELYAANSLIDELRQYATQAAAIDNNPAPPVKPSWVEGKLQPEKLAAYTAREKQLGDFNGTDQAPDAGHVISTFASNTAGRNVELRFDSNHPDFGADNTLLPDTCNLAQDIHGGVRQYISTHYIAKGEEQWHFSSAGGKDVYTRQATIDSDPHLHREQTLAVDWKTRTAHYHTSSTMDEAPLGLFEAPPGATDPYYAFYVLHQLDAFEK